MMMMMMTSVITMTAMIMIHKYHNDHVDDYIYNDEDNDYDDGDDDI